MPEIFANIASSLSDATLEMGKRSPDTVANDTLFAMGPDHVTLSMPGKTVSPAEWAIARQSLDALGHPMSPEALLKTTVTAVSDKQKLSGVNPKIITQDELGNRYLLKPKLKADPKGDGNGGRGRLTPVRSEVEKMSANLRQAAGEPSVMVSDMTLNHSDKSTQFYGKPMLKNEGMLPDNTAQWTASQRNTVMADDVWSRFLGNYDTKVDQYIRISDPSLPEANALNVDWDLALSDLCDKCPQRSLQVHPSPSSNGSQPPLSRLRVWQN
jgi:hypothetical protein